ncbi:MAG: PLP-dependent transferase [Nitrospirae bacterium]|nr:PLP-dependent transferase [Nitrospirota bacterium]
MKKNITGFGTDAVHKGEGQFPHHPSSTPIFQTSTFYFDTIEEAGRVNQGAQKGFVYTRIGNPTVEVFEKKLAALERAEDAVAFASGMAALAAVFLEVLAPGDEMISSSRIYGGSKGFFEQILKKSGCMVRFFDPYDNVQKQIASLVNRKTKLIFFETPSNPELSIIDMRAIASLAKKYRLFSVIDNTFATPYLQHPLSDGIDCVVHSATKYIGGHGDAIGGIVAGSTKFIGRLRATMLLCMGGCISPFNAWLFIRGLKTLHVRMDYHCRSAEKITGFLSGHKKITRVIYPGLKEHPGHEIAKKQMAAYGGMLSFTLESRSACQRFLNNVRLCKIGVSLGDTETLVLNSSLMFHGDRSDAACRKAGMDPALIRVSTGLEDPADIIDDLRTALKSV